MQRIKLNRSLEEKSQYIKMKYFDLVALISVNMKYFCFCHIFAGKKRAFLFCFTSFFFNQSIVKNYLIMISDALLFFNSFKIGETVFETALWVLAVQEYALHPSDIQPCANEGIKLKKNNKIHRILLGKVTSFFLNYSEERIFL